MHDWLGRFSHEAFPSLLALSALSAAAGWAAMRWLGRGGPRRQPVDQRASRTVGRLGRRVEATVGAWADRRGSMVIAATPMVPGSRIALPAEDGANHWRRIMARIGDSGSLLLSCAPEHLPSVREAITALDNPRVWTFVRRSRAPANGIQADVLVLTHPRWLESAEALRVVVADFQPSVRVFGVALKPMLASEADFAAALRLKLADVVSVVDVARGGRGRAFIVSAQVARPVHHSRSH
jgi:hypothetical protein